VSANVLIIDDDESMRMGCLQTLSEAGYRAQAVPNGLLALERARGESFDVVLLDLKMPGIPGMEILKTLRQMDTGMAVIVITGYGSIDTAMQAGKLGAYDFLCKPFDPDQLLGLVAKAASSKRHALEDSCIHMALDDPDIPSDKLVGQSPSFKRVIRLVRKVAPMDSTVLITGETGSGKELVARIIHMQSRRHRHPFVIVDCGSLVQSLFESEMFGHLKGSFTGAIDTTKGKFEIANGGTLFLDEISNIDMSLQARLLRVVQEQEIPKVGSPRTRKVDVRIIAATNKDLLKEIEENRFRKDLFYRLNVVSIHIPPLRERREDIPALAEYFLEKLCRQRHIRPMRISDNAMALMKAYPWPGNVRELRNALERAAVVSEGDVLDPKDLMLSDAASGIHDELSHSSSLAESEKRQIAEVLRECSGNRSQAAARLGINRKTLREKMRKYGIVYDPSPSGEETPPVLQ
jgi:DNA-binding NtrC family response regulator